MTPEIIEGLVKKGAITQRTADDMLAEIGRGFKMNPGITPKGMTHEMIEGLVKKGAITRETGDQMMAELKKKP